MIEQNCIYYKNQVKWPLTHFIPYSLHLYSKRFEVRHQRPFSINKWSLHSHILKLCNLKRRYNESFYFFIQLNIIPIFMFLIVFNRVILVKLEIVKYILIRVILFSKWLKHLLYYLYVYFNMKLRKIMYCAFICWCMLVIQQGLIMRSYQNE